MDFDGEEADAARRAEEDISSWTGVRGLAGEDLVR